MSNLTKQSNSVSIYGSMASFESAKEIAKSLSSSNLVPQNYQGNIPNTMIALEMSNRIGISPFMVMQNLDIIQGKPSWRSTFIIAALNSCGRFKPLRFEFIGKDPNADEYGCRAYTSDLEGNKITGPLVTWKMAKSEGWVNKSGSKWRTMPELMFQYRAASFFGRLYAPDILNGMQSVEEVSDTFNTIDTDYIDTTKEEDLKALFNELESLLDESMKKRIKEIIDNKEVNAYDKAISHLTKKKN